jgi:hypothetical protein
MLVSYHDQEKPLPCTAKPSALGWAAGLFGGAGRACPAGLACYPGGAGAGGRGIGTAAAVATSVG